ncbi:MAG: hydrogenase iron-sulfur subunit [Thermoplasmata archaeon]
MNDTMAEKAQKAKPEERVEPTKKAEHADFDPKIVAFCCHYCSYAAADLAGSMRLQYPTNINILKIPCTGKVDIVYLLRAFLEGADGVIVAGCEEGSCHFINGNIKAKKKVNYTKKILDEVGIGGERLEMYNLSAAMGQRFADLTKEMTERIKKLGPTPKRESDVT